MNGFLKIKHGISASEYEEKYVFITLTGVMALDAKNFLQLLTIMIYHCILYYTVEWICS